MLLFRTLGIVGLVAVVSGCGFQPLYGSRGAENIIGEFSSIRVAPGKDRIGQLLSNELKHLLNPLREPINPKYRLRVKLTEGTTSLAVKKTALATRANLNVNSSYDLVARETGIVVNNGNHQITVSYNIYSSEYATLAAEKDVRKRAVKELAQEIRLQLGAHFKRQAKKAATR